MNPTPACPQGIIEFACELEGVDLVCHLEYGRALASAIRYRYMEMV